MRRRTGISRWTNNKLWISNHLGRLLFWRKNLTPCTSANSTRWFRSRTLVKSSQLQWRKAWQTSSLLVRLRRFWKRKFRSLSPSREAPCQHRKTPHQRANSTTRSSLLSSITSRLKAINQTLALAVSSLVRQDLRAKTISTIWRVNLSLSRVRSSRTLSLRLSSVTVPLASSTHWRKFSAIPQ